MKKFLSIALFTVLSAALLLTGCPNDPPAEKTKVTVTFNLNGVPGTAPASQTFVKGGKATRPTNPSAVGYTFVDWYTTQVATPVPSATAAYNFGAVVNANITLYAGWEQDADNFWFVKFYDVSTVLSQESISKTAVNPTVNELTPEPTKPGYLFLGWSTASPATAETLVSFPLAISGDVNLYALWQNEDALDLSDIILIGGGIGNFQGTTDWFVDLTSAPSTKSAIKISPDTLATGEGASSYRLGFDFDTPVDIRQYGYIEFDVETDGGSPSGTTVLSVFIYKENAEGNPSPEKKMYFLSGAGTLQCTFGEDLWYSTYLLTGFEYYTPAINADTNLYITRVELGGTAVPEPELGEEVEATNIYLTSTAGGSGTAVMRMQTDTVNDTPLVEGGTTYYYRTVYAYFDPLGENFAAIEFTFTRPASGGNFIFHSAIDATQTVNFSGENNYIGWMGWTNPPYWKGDPAGSFSGVNKATLKCVVFNVEIGTAGADGGDLTLTGVKFYKSNSVLDSIAVTSSPSKTTYTVGETFSKAGLGVTATYTAGGGTANVTGSAVLTMGGTSLDGYEFVAEDAGVKTVTVTYTEGEVTKTDTFDITVSIAPLIVASIEVTPPNKIFYVEDDTFNKTGLVVTATYTIGGNADVTSEAVLTMNSTPLDDYIFVAGDVGVQTVTATYKGETDTFDITVYAKPTVALVLFENGAWVGGATPTLTGGSVANNNIEINDDSAGGYRFDITMPSGVLIAGYTQMVVTFTGDNRFFNYTIRTTDDTTISYISNTGFGTGPSPNTVIFDSGQWQNWSGTKKVADTNMMFDGMEIYSGNPAAASSSILSITSIKFVVDGDSGGGGGNDGPIVIFDGSDSGFADGASAGTSSFVTATASSITIDWNAGDDGGAFRGQINLASALQKDLTDYTKFKMDWTPTTGTSASFNISLYFSGNRMLNKTVSSGTAEFDFNDDNPGWAAGWGDAAVGTITGFEIYSSDASLGASLTITKIWFE